MAVDRRDSRTGSAVWVWSASPGVTAKLYDDLMPEWWWPSERGRYHDLLAEVLVPDSCQLISSNPGLRDWSLQMIEGMPTRGRHSKAALLKGGASLKPLR